MKIGVIGAGTMGQGIAKAFAQVEGNTVALCDIKQEWAENGLAKIKKGYEKLVAKGKIPQEKADAIVAAITPGFGGTQRLARLVGMGMAKQLVYSALNIKADEALRIGLVNAVYTQEELMPAALKLAGKIAKNAPIAVRNCKKAINGGISLPIEKAVEVEEKLFGACFETHDQQEGMACFLSREKPKPKAVFTNN